MSEISSAVLAFSVIAALRSARCWWLSSAVGVVGWVCVSCHPALGVDGRSAVGAGGVDGLPVALVHQVTGNERPSQ
ncbi:hypothetical protein BMW24_003975 [Mycobacterium heckeshornense]|nr:hypothetical protein BMW24_003975 [Mycobacterium heckeshornense]